METGRPIRTLPRRRHGRDGRARLCHARAFTLIELVLVLALIALVLGAAVPAMRGFVASRGAADTASELLAMTRLARGQAIAAGQPCRVNIDSNARAFWLSVQDSGTFTEAKTDPGRRIVVPDGVTISLRSDGPPTDNAPAHIEFQPSGRCTAATIEVRGRGGDLHLVTCPSPTEGFHIVTPAEGAQ